MTEVWNTARYRLTDRPIQTYNKNNAIEYFVDNDVGIFVTKAPSLSFTCTIHDLTLDILYDYALQILGIYENFYAIFKCIHQFFFL